MTPLERAARAIADELARQEPQHGGTYFVDSDNLDATVIDGTFDLSGVARAVLEAIREPSEGMVVEGERAAWDDANSMPAPRAIPAAWTSVIDAALAEKPSANE